MPNNKQSELILVILTLGTIIPASWMMDGFYSKAQYLMGLGGCITGSFAAYHLLNDRVLRKGNPALKGLWLFWVLFFVFLGASLFNPSHRIVEVPQGSMFTVAKSVVWLPSVVSVRESAPMIVQLSGTLVLVWSLLALLRSQRKIRALLISLVVNAFVLSLVGAWFKVTGAEHILNIFRAVNPKFFASFTYHNHWVAFAGFHLMVATGLACYYSFHPHRSRQRDRSANLVGFLWVAAFFILLSLLLCESRTGMLWAAAYLGILGLYFLRRKWTALHHRRLRSGWLILIGLMILATAVYQIVLPQLSETSDRMEEAWYAVWDQNDPVDDFRFNVGPQITAELIKEKPTLGWGWGSYALAMSIYAPQFIQDTFAQHAHNDWLQFFAELGVLGCFLFIFPLVHMTIHFKPRNNLTRFTRLGMVMLLGFALFEGPFTNPVILASVLIVLFADLSMGRASPAAD